jgi:hypothetical protein
MNRKVFVSYSRQDGELVLSYVTALREKGVRPWIDRSGIDAASNWSAQIVDAIRESDLVIVMCSRSSVASPNVAREVALATEEKKRILPVMLEETEMPSALRYHLAGIQYITASAKDIETVSAEILGSLDVDDRQRALDSGFGVPSKGHSVSQTGAAPAALSAWVHRMWSALPGEAKFSLFFAVIGAPAWSVLTCIAVLGSEIAPRMVWGLAFLFTLGLLFNLTGLVFAVQGFRRQGRLSEALFLGFLLNLGEAASVLVLGWLAFRYQILPGH